MPLAPGFLIVEHFDSGFVKPRFLFFVGRASIESIPPIVGTFMKWSSVNIKFFLVPPGRSFYSKRINVIRRKLTIN